MNMITGAKYVASSTELHTLLYEFRGVGTGAAMAIFY